MARASSEIATEYNDSLQDLEKVRVKMEALFAGGNLLEDDIEHVYNGLFLEAFTGFEALIETVFLELISGGCHSSESDVVPKLTVSSYDIAQSVVFGGRNYIDWLPFKNTLAKAQAFFVDGYPFMRLKSDPLKSHLNSLERFLSIRNAIAHKSKHAQQKFENKVSGSSPLSPRQRKPAGYLRSSVNRTQVQYQVIANELNIIAHYVCK